jgi:Uma2 family endonuclease
VNQLKKIIPLTEADYLAGELTAEIRHEFVNGLVYVMAGANARHNLIALNVVTHLRNATRGSHGQVFINDMKLRLEARQTFYYPDVMLCCESDDNHDLYREHPCLLAEVLSPSTETIDRREKLLAYQAIVSLQCYMLIASSHKRVEYYQRAKEGDWYHEGRNGCRPTRQ